MGLCKPGEMLGSAQVGCSGMGLLILGQFPFAEPKVQQGRAGGLWVRLVQLCFPGSNGGCQQRAGQLANIVEQCYRGNRIGRLDQRVLRGRTY